MDNIERWTKHTDRELEAIDNMMGYAKMMGATYGFDNECDTMRQEVQVVLKGRKVAT